MPPKKGKKMKNEKIPEGLTELINEAIAKCFLNCEATKIVRITASKIDGVDYQFPIGGLVSFPRQDPEILATKIKENIPENQLLDKLELSDNKTFMNIFTRIKRSQPCKTCGNNTKLGKQTILFDPNQEKIVEQLIQELSKKFSKKSDAPLDSKDRKDTTMAEKLCENFQVLVGGNHVVSDIRKAIETISNRDYPELNSEKIPPIFVPMLFLRKHPEALEYKRYIKELKKMKENIDIERARNLKKAQTILTEEEQELVKSLKRVDELEHIIGEFAEKKVYQFLKDCIEDEEVIVINNLKIMTIRDLDELAKNPNIVSFPLDVTNRNQINEVFKNILNEFNLKKYFWDS
mgnify:CR=1 FL=1